MIENEIIGRMVAEIRAKPFNERSCIEHQLKSLHAWPTVVTVCISMLVGLCCVIWAAWH